MINEIIKNPGPLAPLAGIWKDDKWNDTVPFDDRATENYKFRDRQFKTVRYELKVTVHDDQSFSYKENTQLQIRGQKVLL